MPVQKAGSTAELPPLCKKRSQIDFFERLTVRSNFELFFVNIGTFSLMVRKNGIFLFLYSGAEAAIFRMG